MNSLKRALRAVVKYLDKRPADRAPWVRALQQRLDMNAELLPCVPASAEGCFEGLALDARTETGNEVAHELLFL